LALSVPRLDFLPHTTPSRFLRRPFPPVRAASRLLRTIGTAEALRLARMLTLPARRFGGERFAGEGARALLAGNAMHSGLGPDQAGSACFGGLLSRLEEHTSELQSRENHVW